MAFGTLLKYYKEMRWELIGIDITDKAFGFLKGIKPYIIPKHTDERCFDVIEDILEKERVDLVFCVVDEGLLEWSKRRRVL